MSEIFLINCMIDRGGFLSERTFEIEMPRGGKLIGTANVKYLVDNKKKPLDDDTPEYGNMINGFVQCRKLEEKDGAVLIELPGADVIYVPESELIPLTV